MPAFPASMLRHARTTSRLVAAALASFIPLGAALGAPAPEYGPEAEARFLERCETATDAGTSTCRDLMQRLQAQLGYQAFLEAADGGADAFRATRDYAGINRPVPVSTRAPGR